MVTAGASQPAYDAAASTSTNLFLTNVVVNDLTPTFHGSSSDPNYNSRTFGRWTSPAFELLTGAAQIGLVAHHSPTNAELKAGVYDNVASVQVRCDGGAWFTITGQTVNHSAGGITDWNFTVNTASWVDGLHKCDAVMIPTTGPDGIMNGPPINPAGANADEFQSVDQMIIDNGTRGVSGHIMTIPVSATFYNSRSASSSGMVGIGWSVSAFKVAAGTFVDGDATHNQTSCVAETGSNCTGAGGAGTYHVTVSQQVYGAIGVGVINNAAGGSGNILTVSSTSSGGFNADRIYGPNITTGTTITGNANFNAGNCAAQTGSNCTGSGLAGTYYVDTAQNAISGAVYAVSPATFGNERSYYFLTNANGTLPRKKVFVCQGACNGVTGSDSNNGTSASPVITLAKAYTLAQAADPSTFWKGKYGTTVCIMNSGSDFTYGGGAWTGTTTPFLGALEFAAANSALCGLGTDPGGEAVLNDSNSRLSLPPGRSSWNNLIFHGQLNNLDTHYGQFFIARNVTQTTGIYGGGGIFGGGSYMCLESTSYFGGNGICPAAEMVRNSTGKYSFTDGLHNTRFAINSTFDGVGGDPMTWITGTYSTATPLTLTNVTLPADVTAAGNTLTSLFVGDNIAHGPEPGPPSPNFLVGCLSGNWSGNVVSATSNTMTFENVGQTNAGACANGSTVYLYGSTGDHADQVQLAGNMAAAFDVIYVGNTFNPTYQTQGQAPFWELPRMDGLFMAGNTFTKSPADGEKADAANGGNNNVTYANNIWAGSTSFQHNLYFPSNAETFFKDKCMSGGTLLPPVTAGTNQQSVAAPSNACYTTAP